MLHIDISIFNFQISTLSIHTSQFRHFCFQIFKFQKFHIQISNFSFFFFKNSHIEIQTFQFSKFQNPNIPYIVIPWQVQHMPPEQLINFEYSIFGYKIFLKILYFFPKELVFGIKYCSWSYNIGQSHYTMSCLFWKERN